MFPTLSELKICKRKKGLVTFMQFNALYKYMKQTKNKQIVTDYTNKRNCTGRKQCLISKATNKKETKTLTELFPL